MTGTYLTTFLNVQKVFQNIKIKTCERVKKNVNVCMFKYVRYIIYIMCVFQSSNHIKLNLGNNLCCKLNEFYKFLVIYFYYSTIQHNIYALYGSQYNNIRPYFNVDRNSCQWWFHCLWSNINFILLNVCFWFWHNNQKSNRVSSQIRWNFSSHTQLHTNYVYTTQFSTNLIHFHHKLYSTVYLSRFAR